MDIQPKAPVYRGYSDIIRLLTSEAMKSAKEKQREREPKLEKITPVMRRLRVKILDTRRRLKALEHQLRDDHKARVKDYDGNELTLSNEEYSRLKRAPERQISARLEKIKLMRIKATLDTMDMTPSKAKAYFRRLEQTLAAI